MLNPTVWQWLILACVFFGLEILAPGAFLMWLGFAAVVSAFVKLMIPTLSWEIQYGLFAVLAVISLFAWKRFAKEGVPSEQPTLNQRSLQFVGRTAVLADAIENGVGRVVIEDSQWKVSGPDMPNGSKVKIVDTTGNILQVESAD